MAYYGFWLQIGQLGREDGLAVRTRDHASPAGQCGREVHLVTEQPYRPQGRDGLPAVWALYRRFQPVHRLVFLRLLHSGSYRLIQTLPLLEVSFPVRIGRSTPTVSRVARRLPLV